MRFESLLPGVDIALSPRHRFTTDSVLLARFAAPRRREAACDLCCGGGIVPLLWQGEGETSPRRTVGLDLDGEAADLFQASIERNGLSGRLSALRGDLRDPPAALLPGSFDLVTCNPPYHRPAGEGSPERGLIRQEVRCTLEEVCAAAARLLRFGGRFCLCHRPARLADLCVALRASGIEPKRLRMAARRLDTAPRLLLLEGRRGGKPGLEVLPQLVLEEEDGSPSAEYRQIYRMR